MTFTRYFLLASMLPTVVFLVIPGMLYFSNRIEWGNDIFPLLLFASYWLLANALIAALYRLFGSLRAVFANTLFVLGLVVLVNDVVSPLQVGIMDGQALLSEQPLVNTLVEIVAAVVVCVMFVRAFVKGGTWPATAALVTLCTGMLLLVVSLVATISDRQGVTSDEPGIASSHGPNIYHIHLDAMQTDFFARYLNQSSHAKAFDGFVFYQNNIANYPFTIPSVTSYLTGTVYESGRYDHWLKTASDGMPAQLQQQAYQLFFYGKKAVLETSAFSQSVFAYDLVKQHASMEHAQLVDFIRIWLARVSPNMFTNRALALGGTLGEYHLQVINGDAELDNVPLTIEAGIEPYSGVLMLRRIIADEAQRSATGQYVLVQPLLPHGPFVIDSRCNYRGLTLAPKHAYYEQVECAGELLQQFFAQLKKLKRYRDSLIIIHGDHGSGWAGLLDSDGSLEQPASGPFVAPVFRTWNAQQMLSRASALLMVKPPGASGPLHYSNFESQLVDVYATAMAAVGLPVAGGVGINLFGDVQGDEKRNRRFYLFEPGRSASKSVSVYAASNDDSGRLSLRQVDSLDAGVAAGSLSCNAVLDFSDPAQAEEFDVQGLSAVESWGRWTDGAAARLVFTYQPGRCQPTSLRINSRAFVASDSHSVVASVSLNGLALGTMEHHADVPGISEARVFSFDLPKAVLLADEPNTLAISIEGAVSPVSVGYSNDSRVLGLGLLTLSLVDSPALSTSD